MNDFGQLQYFLGVKIEQDWTAGVIWMEQPLHTSMVLHQMNVNQFAHQL